MIYSGLLALIALSGALSTSAPFHPLSDELIDHINGLQTTWTAGRNFHKDTPMSHIRKLHGVLRDEKRKYLEKIHLVRADGEVIPESFDAREEWPHCESIRTIRDQAGCGACWAVAAAAAMSDRICIFSNGTDQRLVSDEDLNTCCWQCGYGCGGGYPDSAWSYWKDSGIVYGGPYNSTTGCKAYSMEPCSHPGGSGNLPKCQTLGYEDTPECVSRCDDDSPLSYDDSKTFASEVYGVGTGSDDGFVEEIQLEIMRNGPVEASIVVYDDFLTYKSGVYQHITGDYIGGHAIRIIGWGVENDVPYWLITNSWNEGWGDKGLFKILRGSNECIIEQEVVAGLPKM